MKLPAICSVVSLLACVSFSGVFNKGAEHEHFESWGEQLTNCHHTVVCKLHIATGTTTILDCVPDEYSAGQVLMLLC